MNLVSMPMHASMLTPPIIPNHTVDRLPKLPSSLLILSIGFGMVGLAVGHD